MPLLPVTRFSHVAALGRPDEDYPNRHSPGTWISARSCSVVASSDEVVEGVCAIGGEWRNWRRLTLLLVCAGLAGCVSAPPTRDGPPDRSAPIEGTRRSPLSEPPGAYFDEVTQETVQTTICVSGWTATVRPSTSFTNGVKLLMLKRAGLPISDAQRYELDHFVPLALGGHPRSEDNLWLEPWNGTWNAKVKDHLERKLQVMVCVGQMTLSAARRAIQDGWKAAYRKFLGTNPRDLNLEDRDSVD